MDKKIPPKSYIYSWAAVGYKPEEEVKPMSYIYSWTAIGVKRTAEEEVKVPPTRS